MPKPKSVRGCPSKRDHGGGHSTTATIHRWAVRKKNAQADAQDRFIDDVASVAGGRWGRFVLYKRACHMYKVKADKAKAEREMLATTSLGKLIK